MNSKKINIGDKVAVIDDIIKGIIVAIENNLVKIEDENGFIYQYNKSELVLSANNLLDNIVVSNKDKILPKKKTLLQQKKKETVLEVDLHIHQITKSNKYMQNSEMLKRQLEVAESKLKYAISKRISKVIFIHGKGQGVLKTELKYLLKKYPVSVYDASFKNYGQGATEVKIFLSKI